MKNADALRTSRRIVSLLALFLFLAAAPASAGNKYVVDVSVEAGMGDTAKTVAGGLLKLKGPGDELVIRKGLYVGSLEIKNLKGDRNTPIIIHGERDKIPPEEANLPNVSPAKYAPLVKADKDNVLVIRDCSYITIDGLIMTGAKDVGVLLENSDHITFRNCDIVDNVKTQLQAKGGRKINLEQCELAGSLLEHGCQFWGSDQPTVQGCRIHDNAASGIYANGAKKEGGDGLIDGALFEGNILHENGKLRDGAVLPRNEKGREQKPVTLRFGAAAIAGDGLERSIIRNNLIHHNHVGGIVLYRDDAERAGQNTRVLHNTIYLPAATGNAYGINLALMTQGTALLNNVIVASGGPTIWLGQGATREMQSDFNVLYRLDNKGPLQREKEELPLNRWQETFRLDRNSVAFNPPFVVADSPDPGACDFQLKKESSMTGRGQYQWDAQTDLLGRWRPKDRVTPGCYELSPAAGNPNVNQPPPGPHRRPKPDQPTPPKTDPPKDPDKPPPIILPPID